MNTELLLRIAGVALVGLVGVNIYVPHYFKWRAELADVSVFTRQVFFVHMFFIVLIIALQAALCLFLPHTLTERSTLAQAVLGGFTLFWAARLYGQFFVYDPVVWRGNRLHTLMHILFGLLWCFLSGVFAWALYRQFA